MNFVFLSPYFPLNYYRFCVALKQAGATVLAIGDMPYDELRDELKLVLTEYYKVDDLHNRDQLRAACDHFIKHHGKIDRIESHNEYWLETDAWLRTLYEVPGLKSDQMKLMKSKNGMKEAFTAAGVTVPRGQIVSDLAGMEKFINQVGYPVIVKPDNGVGASKTYRLNNVDDLTQFYTDFPDQPYIMEEFIEGQIHTFDGLVDSQGNVVFYTSHIYQDGIMECVLDQLDVTFYSVRQVADDLTEAGKQSITAFGITERFFHFEYFRKENGQIVSLEANMRPPGGPILDMMNYANDINIYQEWANMVVTGESNTHFYNPAMRNYFCAFVGRRDHKQYQASHDDIMNRFGAFIPCHEALPPVYAEAMGNYFYIVRASDYETVAEIRSFIMSTV